MKTCTKCGETKPLDGFGRNNSARDGKRSHCKLCTNTAMLARKAVDPDKVRAIGRASAKKRRAERGDEYRAAKRVHHATYRERHREALAEWQRDYHRTPEGRALRSRLNSARRARENNVTHAPYARATIFARWSSLCCYCDARATALDHVTPISKGGADAEWNLVPACQSCNSSKGAKSLADWASTF